MIQYYFYFFFVIFIYFFDVSEYQMKSQVQLNTNFSNMRLFEFPNFSNFYLDPLGLL